MCLGIGLPVSLGQIRTAVCCLFGLEMPFTSSSINQFTITPTFLTINLLNELYFMEVWNNMLNLNPPINHLDLINF